jgi:hypothetical protein
MDAYLLRGSTYKCAVIAVSAQREDHNKRHKVWEKDGRDDVPRLYFPIWPLTRSKNICMYVCLYICVCVYVFTKYGTRFEIPPKKEISNQIHSPQQKAVLVKDADGYYDDDDDDDDDTNGATQVTKA